MIGVLVYKWLVGFFCELEWKVRGLRYVVL